LNHFIFVIQLFLLQTAVLLYKKLGAVVILINYKFQGKAAILFIRYITDDKNFTIK
jgi:hypothetical protein